MFAQLFCLRLYDELWEQTQSELLPQAIGFFIQLHKTSKGVEIDPRTGQVSVVVVLPPPVPAHSYPVQPSPIYDRLLGEADEHAQANLGAARRKLSVNDIKQDMSPHSTPLSSSILSTSQSALVQPAGSETIVLPAPVVATATETATGPNICICRAAVTELLDFDPQARPSPVKCGAKCRAACKTVGGSAWSIARAFCSSGRWARWRHTRRMTQALLSLRHVEELLPRHRR